MLEMGMFAHNRSRVDENPKANTIDEQVKGS